ncbi:bleomycin resistance protein [Aurantiacibacter marinus]|uniref:Bleomycin resistance protein n=2 Tax=Aurantiacibacter marinus TaxID=874156 RepID=A0A0H0XT92_9SPHN|nr:bleomycin resistance protein [Aurantiacibacter marinus]
MHVERLDHINIVTDRLDETADWYATMLDLERRNAPPPMMPEAAQWMHDGQGRAIIHLNSLAFKRTFDRPVDPGSHTGAVHHVALRMQGYEEVVARLKAHGANYRENFVEAINLRQVFTTDPNNVLLELNFFAA